MKPDRTIPGTSDAESVPPRFLVTICLILLGVAAGAYLGSSVIGGLVGFLVARRTEAVRARARDATDSYPNARTSLILASGAWITFLLIWGWVFTRPPGAFHDQGGMLITFLIIPVTGLCWLVGGPSAGLAARRAIRQVTAGTRPESDRLMARRALFLSRAMSLVVAGAVLWSCAELIR